MSANQNRSGFLGYDLFKLVVALGLLIILILLLLRACSAGPGLAQATQAATTLPTQITTFTPGTIAPVITSPHDGDQIEGLQLTLKGTGQPGQEIEIIDTGSVEATVSVGSDGQWSFEYQVEPGPHQFIASTLDGSLKSAPVNVNGVPTAANAPTASAARAPEIVSPRDGEQVHGPARIQGSGQPGTQLQISDSGKDIGSVMVDKGGNWLFDTTIYEGRHVFVASTADGSLKSKPVSVTVVPQVADTLVALPSPTSPPPTPTNPPPTTTPAIASGGGGCSPSGIPPNGFLKDKDHYVVGSCDTLSGIAIWLKVTVDSLLASNPQITNPDKIVPGQVITVPPRPE